MQQCHLPGEKGHAAAGNAAKQNLRHDKELNRGYPEDVPAEDASKDEPSKGK